MYETKIKIKDKNSSWYKKVNSHKKLSESAFREKWEWYKELNKKIIMLDTIIIGILILSALIYGFWQYYAEPDNASKKQKSKQKKCLVKNILKNIQPRVLVLRARHSWRWRPFLKRMWFILDLCLHTENISWLMWNSFEFFLFFAHPTKEEKLFYSIVTH